MTRRQRGVSLIELMVVVTIVAILGAIALPAYRNYVVRSNRTDAKTKLIWVAGALERCYTRNNSYDTGAAGCSVTLPATSDNGLYSITAAIAVDNQSFTLTAAPQGEQAQDTGCANFTLSNVNLRGVTGTKPVAECWGR